MTRRKKPVRRNTYRNSASKSRARRFARLATVAKMVFGILALAAASFVFIFSYDYLTQCAYFEARQIRVSGNQRLAEGAILGRARIETGINILSVNLHVVRQRLLADPWIAEALVSRELPDALEIRVTEQRPLAVLDLGRKFLLNETGQVFMELKDEDPGPLPLVTGLQFPDIRLPGGKGSPAYEAVMEVLRLGRFPGTALPLVEVRRIHVDRQLGLTLHAFEGPKRIKLGFRDYPEKYDRLRTVLLYWNRNSRLPDFSAVDLNDRNRIVVTPVRASAPEEAHEEV